MLGVLSIFGSSPKIVSFHGINFNIPSNWKVTEKKADINGIITINAEKKGWDASGLITITAFPGEGNQKETLEIFKNKFSKTSIYKLSNIAFDPITSKKFGKYDSHVAPYLVSFLGIKHRGSIYCIKLNNTFYIILLQEAIEDSGDNAEGFVLIKESFVID